MTDIQPYNPKIMVERLQAQIEIVNQVRTNVLVKDVDYGVIPGTPKPTLYQPGAQKLIGALRLSPIYKLLTREIDRETGWIFYEFLCELYDETGFMVAQAIGNCNSYEQKYRRWVTAAELPKGFDTTGLQTRESSLEEFEFAINKRETGGKWGKPADYWDAWETAIADGTAVAFQKRKKDGSTDKAWRVHTVEYNLPNPNIYDQLNTICKMAQKRAFVGATVMGARASDYFTQDIEDMPQFGDIYNRMSIGAADAVIDAAFEEIHDTEPRPAKQPPAPARPMPKAEPASPAADTPTWYDNKAQTAKFTDECIALGLGDSPGDVWSYIKTRLIDGKALSSLRESGLDYDAAIARVRELADELRNEVGAPNDEPFQIMFNEIRMFNYKQANGNQQPAAELIPVSAEFPSAVVWSETGVRKYLIDTGWLDAQALEDWVPQELELDGTATATVKRDGKDKNGNPSYKVLDVEPSPFLMFEAGMAGSIEPVQEDPAPKPASKKRGSSASKPLGTPPAGDEVPF